MGAGVAVGLFVGLSVFICIISVTRIIGLVRLRTGRVRVPRINSVSKYRALIQFSLENLIKVSGKMHRKKQKRRTSIKIIIFDYFWKIFRNGNKKDKKNFLVSFLVDFSARKHLAFLAL